MKVICERNLGQHLPERLRNEAMGLLPPLAFRFRLVQHMSFTL
jgi:hypothetical protein